MGASWCPGSVEALRTLIESGKEIVFVTNNSVKQPAAYAVRLREAGVDVGGDRVVTAGAATAQLAAERVGARGHRLRDRGARLQGDGRRSRA